MQFYLFLIISLSYFMLSCSSGGNGGSSDRNTTAEEEANTNEDPKYSAKATVGQTCKCADNISGNNTETITKKMEEGKDPLTEAEKECTAKGKMIINCGPI